LFNQVSFAKTVKPFRIFDWLGGATFDDQTNQFVSCSANSTNSRGISISYLVNDQYAWTLAFSNSSWNFSPGFTFVLALKINDQMFSNQRAVFVSNQALQIHLSDSLPVFEMLQNGRKLQVQARGINFDFELNASDEVLFALVDCVDRHTARGHHSKSNSRNAKRASAVKLPVIRDAAAMAEATSLASQIVAHAQIPNSQVLSPKDIPSGLQVDAVWKSGLVLGSVEILPPNANAKIGDVAIKIVEQAASGCRGKLFAATTLGEIDQSKVVRAVTSCRSADMITTRNYLGIPRDSGGYYVLGTSENGFDAAHPKQRPAKELANKISAVITQVLSKFKPPDAAVSE
jgi:hypothetical protein